MLVFVIVVLILYYLLFVRAEHHLRPPAPASHVDLENRLYDADGNFQSQLASDRMHGGGKPAFSYVVRDDRIAVAGKEWRLPKLPTGFAWTVDRTIEATDACFGKSGFVPAVGKDVYDYVESHRVYLGHSEEENDAAVGLDYVSDAKRIYYFQCTNNKIERLYHCPRNSIFVQTECTAVDTCKSKPDGYRYENPSDRQRYYQCRNGTSVEMKCPPQQFFVSDRCEKAADPCEHHDDFFVYDFTDRTYKQCYRGKTYAKSCLKNEYFHAGLLKCVPNVCQRTTDGIVPHWKTYFEKIYYATSFTRCTNGIATETVHCDRSSNEAMSLLPIRSFVFDGGECRPPVWCRNLKPVRPGVAIPGENFRTTLANYLGSDLLDRMYGYECDEGGQAKTRFLAPNEMIDTALDIVPICRDTTGTVPVLDQDLKFTSYYDCGQRSVQSCPRDEFYDVQKRECVPDIPRPHLLRDKMQIFHLEPLDPITDWFLPRKLLAATEKVECEEGSLLRIPHYNVCADPECSKFPFLAQINRGIYLDDQFACVFKNNAIRRRRHDRRGGGKLDFWKQKFRRQPERCHRGRTLESGDFLMDATVFATCNDASPFVFCPMSKIAGVENDQLCIPESDVLLVRLPPDTEISLYRGDVKHLYAAEDDCTITVVFDGIASTYGTVKNREYSPSQFGVTYTRPFVLKATKTIIIQKKKVPTNNPEYYIDIRGRAINKTYHHLEGRNANEDEEFEMERYDYDDRSIRDLY